MLYKQRFPDLHVATIQKTKDYGGDFVVLLCGEMEIPHGTLVELKRPIGEHEPLFALVEIRNRTSQGNYLGIPIWSSPGHQRDFFAGKFTAVQLTVFPYVARESVDRLRQSP
jgi:hypothetical protein